MARLLCSPHLYPQNHFTSRLHFSCKVEQLPAKVFYPSPSLFRQSFLLGQNTNTSTPVYTRHTPHNVLPTHTMSAQCKTPVTRTRLLVPPAHNVTPQNYFTPRLHFSSKTDHARFFRNFCFTIFHFSIGHFQLEIANSTWLCYCG